MTKQDRAKQYLITYAERLDIIAPRMITDKKEYEKFGATHAVSSQKINRKRNNGRAFWSLGVIWVNVRKSKGLVGLRHTIAHELIHMKYGRKLYHGKKFDRLTMDVIMNRVFNTHKIY